MPNTIVQSLRMIGALRVVSTVSIDSDGTDESDLVIYNSSDAAALVGVSNPLNCRILKIWHSGGNVGTTVNPMLKFEGSPSVLCVNIQSGQSTTSEFIDYTLIKGLENLATSPTGNIVYDGTFASGDRQILVLEVLVSA